MESNTKFLSAVTTKEYLTMEEIARQMGFENKTPEIDLLQVRVYHRNVNRPQMFLTGFEEHFDNERVQIIGGTEMVYLSNCSSEERTEKFRRLCATGIPGIVVTHGRAVPEELITTAERFKVPVLWTQQETAGVMVDCISWINEQLAPSATLYGVFVDVYGEGILITGHSGVGKSETAVELIKRGHRLVADDIVEVSKVGDRLLMGQAPALTRHFVELRGIGIVDVKSLYGVESVRDRAPIDMIVNLEEWDENKTYDRLGLNEEYEDILGVKVVKHSIPLRVGRNLAIIVETAAVNNRQKKMGYNAAQEMCDRVSAEIHSREEN